MNWFQKLFYYLMFPIISISYILTPLTNDARIYLGVEYIADKFYPYPYGWDIAWEIKPMANRLMAWVMYKIASSVVPFENAVLFGAVVKLIALCIITAVIWYFAKTVGGRWTFPLTFIAFTCIGNFVILQAEYWALIWSLLAIALLLHDNENYHALAGALFIVIALFKGITGLLCIPILCAVLLLKPGVRLYLADLFFGFCGALGTFLLLCLTVWHYALPDMLMSAQVARVGEFPYWMYFMSLIAYLFSAVFYIPLVSVGCLAGLVYILRKGYTDIRTALLCLLMWVVPFAIIYIQGEFFVYHYVVLTLPTLITLILWNRERTTKTKESSHDTKPINN